MSDISSQLIKDSYNYVLQSDVSTGNIYRIGGGIPVNPIFLSGLTVNGVLIATTISSGPVIIKSNNNDQLLLTTTNYNSGSDGNILYFYTQTGITYSNISARTNGGSSNADLVLQESIGSNVGIGKVPSSIYKLDVNGAIGATSISATTITTPFSGGSVLFAGTSGQISQKNSQLFWDNTNNRFGIGTNSPDKLLTIYSGTTNTKLGLSDTGIYFSRISDGSYVSFVSRRATSGGLLYDCYSDVHEFSRGGTSLAFIASTAQGGATGYLSIPYFSDFISASGRANSPMTVSSDAASGDIDGIVLNRTSRSSTSSNTITTWKYNSTEVARMTQGGSLFIGTSVDSGYRLDVNGGTSRFSGNVTLSSQLNLPGNNFSGTYKILVNSQPSSGDLISGTRNCIQDQVNFFNPNSGSSTVYNSFVASPTINQTNGSSGTTRGLYINPTITSAFDFRAIETVTGNVILGSTSGNTLIGTSVDSGYKLDVSGTVRVTGDTTALTFNASNNGGSYKVQGTNVLDYGNGVRIGYFNGVQKITLYTNAGTPQLTVLNTGNVLIGTTTDAGYKLDVNGTARITGGLTATTISATTLTIGGITATTLSGTTSRMVESSSTGEITANSTIITAYITSGGTVANLLENTSNWDINGVYTGSTITGTFQGQKHYNPDYFFEAVDDNLFIRLIRG
jgi:hypothetical protein